MRLCLVELARDRTTFPKYTSYVHRLRLVEKLLFSSPLGFWLNDSMDMWLFFKSIFYGLHTNLLPQWSDYDKWFFCVPFIFIYFHMHGLIGLKFICGADQDYNSSSTHPTHVIIFLQTPTTVWDQEYSEEKGGKKIQLLYLHGKVW